MEQTNYAFSMYDSLVALFRFVGFDFILFIVYRLFFSLWYER